MKLFSIIGPISVFCFSLSLGAAHPLTIFGQETPAPAETPVPEEPVVAQASPNAAAQLETFRLPKGWRGELWAAEPLVANPVAFAIDHEGRVFVCESFRQEQGVTDNRTHDETWVDHDLASNTVTDRIAYHQKLLPFGGKEYVRQDDRVRRVIDSDGDGIADRSDVFANRFNRLEDGSIAGVLIVGDEVWVTCIPDLWRLRDEDRDGRADERTSLQTGFGVRVAFRGHDLHGLTTGPDGRIYFSIGDRGYHLETVDGRVLADPESGAVFRCEVDGSGLEVFATGLRNPQELAFDQWGNLFTGDNNSDSGDRARWVFLLPGSDSGWRMAYQYLPDRGPFNRERIWRPFHLEQPAYVFPPVANIGDGPSGLIYYPGTGIGEELDDCFLMCDFRGTPATSGIRAIRVKPDGAFFKIANQFDPVWHILATDLAIGPDGWLYVSDWVNGWVGEGKGRIYRFADSNSIAAETVRTVETILRGDWRNYPLADLRKLLNHADQRIRLQSQFELVRRKASDELNEAAHSAPTLHGRVHGLWGIDQLARISDRPDSVLPAIDLLRDQNPEIRAQAARILGERRISAAIADLAGLVQQRDSARAQMWAVMAFANLVHPQPEVLVFELSANNDRDPALRHALIMALANQNLDSLVKRRLEIMDDSAARGVVAALRKKNSDLAAEFLDWPNVLVAEEAARAIHDVPIESGLDRLAESINLYPQSVAFTHRAMNAAFRLGSLGNATALARLAGDEKFSPELRIEAIEMLGSWDYPSARDRVLGMWRPIAPRSNEPARQAIAATLNTLTATREERVLAQFIMLVGRLKVAEATEFLTRVASQSGQSVATRASAIRALGDIDAAQHAKLILQLSRDDHAAVRTAAVDVLAEFDPKTALDLLKSAIDSEDLRERQAAWARLAELQSTEVTALLIDQLKRLNDSGFPDDTRLDLLIAAEKHAQFSPEVEQLVEKLFPPQNPTAPTRRFQYSMNGGDEDRGQRIFKEWTQVSCLRCHRVGDAGGYVGPNLSDIGVRKDRKYLMEAIVDPNRVIAENFETVIVLDVNGLTHSGIVNYEDDHSLRLMMASGDMVTIDKSAIDERLSGKSAMPEDVTQHLTPFDVRDLVEFLAKQNTPPEVDPETLERDKK